MKLITTLFLVILTRHFFAQDLHFSHQEFAPLQLNSALCGSQSKLRGTINYRNQWAAIGAPFSSFSGSFDARLTPYSYRPKTAFSVGLSMFSDRSNSTFFTTNAFHFHLASLIPVNRTNSLGIGINIGYGQRSLTELKGRWLNQYDGQLFHPELPSGESFFFPTKSYLDAGAGLVWKIGVSESSVNRNNKYESTFGLSAAHLNEPILFFQVNEKSERLKRRYNFFWNGVFGIDQSRWSVAPGIYIYKQGSATQGLLGSYFKYRIAEASRVTGFNKSSYFSIGVFERGLDAIILKSMIEHHTFTVGGAFDFTHSALQRSNGLTHAFEFFLVYEFPLARSLNNFKF